jgi:hypothetical protein
VRTPAANAVLRLARTRPIAFDVLAASLDAPDRDGQLYATDALKRALSEAPASLRPDIADIMVKSNLEETRRVGREWKETIETRRQNHEPNDVFMF